MMTVRARDISYRPASTPEREINPKKREQAMKRLLRASVLLRSVIAIVLSALSTTVARGDFLETSGLGDEILRFRSDGRPGGRFVAPGSGGLNSPESMTWGPDG